jgi:Na+-driven multidrug efflux pump
MIIEQTGERPLAVSNIIRGMYMIFTIPIFSLGSATNTIVSNTMGENRANEVLPTILRISKISLVTILVFIAVAGLFAREFIAFYTNDEALIQASFGPYYVILGVLIFFSVSIILFNGVAGTANTKVSLLIELFSVLLYLVLAYYLAIVSRASTVQIWMSEFLYFGMLGLLSFLYLRKGNWAKKQI